MQSVLSDIWLSMLLMNLYAKRSLLFAFHFHWDLEKLIPVLLQSVKLLCIFVFSSLSLTFVFQFHIYIYLQSPVSYFYCFMNLLFSTSFFFSDSRTVMAILGKVKLFGRLSELLVLFLGAPCFRYDYCFHYLCMSANFVADSRYPAEHYLKLPVSTWLVV